MMTRNPVQVQDDDKDEEEDKDYQSTPLRETTGAFMGPPD
jgi:hypothetical protein